jgi:major vault protein
MNPNNATVDRNILLTNLGYCHVINDNSGIIRLIEGPFQGLLNADEHLYGEYHEKIILLEGQYIIIVNPYDKLKKEVTYGEREIRQGPAMFSLFPGEKIERTNDGENLRTDRVIKLEEFEDEEGFTRYNTNWDGVRDQYVLKSNKGLLVKAIRDFKENNIEHKAGDMWLIKGPTSYIPHKYVEIKKKIKALSLGNYSGIYIKNIITGEVRLEKGPCNIMLSPEEILYEKQYTDTEKKAIGFGADYKASNAYPLWLLENEVCLVMDEQSQRAEIGPKVLLLGPFERPYIMSISGSTPKVPNVLNIWRIRLGPDFCSDKLIVRTKDNAVLSIWLRYKWQFDIDPMNKMKIFKIKDFIGFATDTMAGLIRNEAAKYTFEDFHSDASVILKNILFKDSKPFLFHLNGFKIFDLDIKEIMPRDTEIAAQLNDAIKSNMKVYVDKIQQEAKLKAEKDLIDGQKLIEEKRRELITIRLKNQEEEQLGKAKIESKTALEKAQGEAEALKVRTDAELAAKIDELSQMIGAFDDEADKYIELERVKSLKSINKMLIVPSDAKMILPLEHLDN